MEMQSEENEFMNFDTNNSETLEQKLDIMFQPFDEYDLLNPEPQVGEKKMIVVQESGNGAYSNAVAKSITGTHHSEEDVGDDDCDENEDSICLSKRTGKDGTQRKKRLKGKDLIQSLKKNPMFKDHEELFNENLDDITRKRMMQKIRNRISAQESRDRKKEQFCDLNGKNQILVDENNKLKAELDRMLRENENLKKQLLEKSSKHERSSKNSTEPVSELNSVDFSEKSYVSL